MKHKLLLVAIFLAIILIGGAVLLALTPNPSTTQETNNNTQDDLNEPQTSPNDNATEPTTDNSDSTEQPSAEAAGEYIAYDSTKLTSKRNVIFFAASWCPSCRELDTNLRTKKEEIPSDLTILKADFDNEVSLKQKYGVTIQHTFVQVDKSGKQIHKWNGLYKSYTLEEVLKELR